MALANLHKQLATQMTDFMKAHTTCSKHTHFANQTHPPRHHSSLIEFLHVVAFKDNVAKEAELEEKISLARQVYIRAHDLIDFSLARGCPKCGHQLHHGLGRTGTPSFDDDDDDDDDDDGGDDDCDDAGDDYDDDDAHA